LSKKLVQTLNKIATPGVKPDLTILLDIEPGLGLSRAAPGGGDRLEQEELAFHKRVREGYLKIAKEEPGRVKVVRVKENIEKTDETVRKYVGKCLSRK
jgi:dTMP kinase